MVGVEIDGAYLNINVEYFNELGLRIRKSIVEVTLDILRELRQLVVFGFLSGQVLNRVTGKLITSIRTAAFAGTDSFTGRLYQRVDLAPYGPVHEVGGVFHVPAHMRTLRNGGTTLVRAHTMRVPRRSYLERAMQEKSQEIRQRIQAAIESAKK